ncbi:hypothetical protein [Streptomyces sp. SP18BB07]|uniref:hypothetical protein n=1 Tax=Streptomyces sp. SP18BB07 TaxID=3002522 RepID=UPI002E7785B5|nr:hypothetical protein [Streptomyces sp. SP18BB07]MEE1766337.1 hypothetical protein [Streptomyces sp. SP18BB07]
MAVLTRNGSFACHGANILRAAQQRKPLWITDIEGFGSLSPGMVLNIEGPDLWISGTRPPVASVSPDSRRDRSQWFRSPRHEICEWDVEKEPMKVVRRCYWSHRRYDRMTASVMTEGLGRSATALGGNGVQVFAEEDLLWFIGAPSGDAIAEIACDTVASAPFLSKQEHVYGRLVKRLRGFPLHAGKTAEALASLYSMLTDYFSVHLLLHSTYEDVFLATREQLVNELPGSVVEEFFDVLLSPEIVKWQDRLNPQNRKDLLQVRVPSPLPETEPSGEIANHRNKSLEWLLAHSSGLSSRSLERISHAAEVEVLKEWKFALNKLLFSRFGAVVDLLMLDSGLSEEEIRVLSISEMIAVAEEANT